MKLEIPPANEYIPLQKGNVSLRISGTGNVAWSLLSCMRLLLFGRFGRSNDVVLLLSDTGHVLQSFSSFTSGLLSLWPFRQSGLRVAIGGDGDGRSRLDCHVWLIFRGVSGVSTVGRCDSLLSSRKSGY